MNKAGLIWCAKGLGLDTSGTAPEIEQRIAVENTRRDAEIVRISDPVMADVLVAIAPLRHQLADRATLADIEPDTARDYYAEEKLDGMRIWLVGYRHRYFVFSRNYTVDIRLNAITNIANINLDGFPSFDEMTIFDAEYYVDNKDTSRHDRLGKAIGAFASIGRVSQRPKPVIFDVIMLNGIDVSGAEYGHRRDMLSNAGVNAFMNLCLVGSVPEIFDYVVASGGEGLVLKQKDCEYLFGQRKGWYKLKTGYADGANEYSAVITGMGDKGRGRNAGLVGSVAISDMHGNPLGEVGNFDDYTRRQLTDETTGLLKERLIGKVIEVRAMELTRDGKLRHAAFKRFLT